jgi:tetratricopeptide (TPR) repeat protein
LTKEGKYTEALGVVAGSRPILGAGETRGELAAMVCDRWSRHEQEKGNWQGAVDAYAKALEQFPRDGRITHNAIATWDAWAATYIEKKDWAGAIKVYRAALERFPDDSHLENNRKYCESQAQK